jgi:hypothetical protein
MTAGKQGKAGRRAIKIDVAELEKLCAMQCTDEEIAAWFGVSERTIQRRRNGPGLAKAIARGKAKGRISVRRNPIWAGGQRQSSREYFPRQESAALPRFAAQRALLAQTVDLFR